MVKINKIPNLVSDSILKMYSYSPTAPVVDEDTDNNTNIATKDTASSEGPLKASVYDMSRPCFRSQDGTDICVTCKAADEKLGYDETTCRYYRTAKYHRGCYWLRFGFICDLVLTKDQKPLND